MESIDRDVYRAAIQGDRDAFEMIIRASSRTLFAIAYGVLQNQADAEDAVQDTFIKAWKARWRVRDPEKFPAWLATIARHRARDLARRHAAVPLASDFEQVPISEPADQTEMAEQVNAALARLPETHRVALSLRYFEELDYATIERTLGLTNGALRGILGRALQTLRKTLQPVPASLD